MPAGYCAAVTDPIRADPGGQAAEQLPAGPLRQNLSGRRERCLPSAHVIEELVRVVPDLNTIAEELRIRLTE
jgi:hypothetical protein